MLDISLEGIKDPVVRDAFYTVLEFLRGEPEVNFKWKFYEKTFPSGGTYTFPHGLGFKPKDFRVTNNAAGYVDLDECTNTNVVVVVAAASTMRFTLGNLDVNSQA